MLHSPLLKPLLDTLCPSFELDCQAPSCEDPALESLFLLGGKGDSVSQVELTEALERLEALVLASSLLHGPFAHHSVPLAEGGPGQTQIVVLPDTVALFSQAGLFAQLHAHGSKRASQSAKL